MWSPLLDEKRQINVVACTRANWSISDMQRCMLVTLQRHIGETTFFAPGFDGPAALCLADSSCMLLLAGSSCHWGWQVQMAYGAH